jgi:hypothetical protein
MATPPRILAETEPHMNPSQPSRESMARWVWAPRVSQSRADYASPIERKRPSVAGELFMGVWLVAFLLFLFVGLHFVAALWPQIAALVSALKGV